MSEQEFQRKMIDQMARMETKQDLMLDTVKCNTVAINQHSDRITRTEDSTKSAHHRIEGIFWGAGILGALAGWVVNFVSSSWKGGHG